MPLSLSKSSLSLVISAVLLGGCVSEESVDTGNTASSTNASSSTSSSTDNSTTSSSSSSGNSGNGAFFNDQDGLDFANSLGGNLSRLFSAALGGSSGAIARNPQSESGISVRATSNETSTCDTGSVAATTVTDDNTGELTSLDLVFNNCNSGGTVSSGSVGMVTSGSGANQQIDLTFNNFATADQTSSSSINGSISMSGSDSGSGSSFNINGPELTMQTNEETVSFRNYSLSASNDYESGASSLGLNANISSSVDGDVSVTIDPPLTVPDDTFDYPTGGRIQMVHADGSALDINADNGDASTFDYIVTNNGSTTSGTESWEDSDLVVPEQI